MPAWGWFLGGLIVGAVLGVVALSLCLAASRDRYVSVSRKDRPVPASWPKTWPGGDEAA